MPKTIRMGDTVLHLPSGEMWCVCGVNYEQGSLIPCGYPFPTRAQISDCEFVERPPLSEQEHGDFAKALQRAGCESYIQPWKE